jgi:ABC-type transport system involved in cytochrome bd biosynthesis fused ATPase/permease subunit
MQAVLRLGNWNAMTTLAYASPAMFAAAGWVLAQTAGLDPSVANLIGNGVTVAVLAFYVVYDVRVRTPNMLGIQGRERRQPRDVDKND